jgi:hypothetical protein
MTAADRRKLWRCPECGHRFVSANLWHSCGRFRVADHFRGRPPALREIYRAYLRLARSFGPVHVYAQKTRIVFQREVRFAGVTVRARYVEAGMWLTRSADHPTLLRRLKANDRDVVHYFRLQSVSDVDGGLRALMREAHAIGRRQHLRKKAPIDE